MKNSTPPRRTKATVKGGGGSVMVWGCFTRSGSSPIRRIQGIMNVDVYCNVLEGSLVEFADANMLPHCIYQQDTDPKHKLRRAMQ